MQRLRSTASERVDLPVDALERIERELTLLVRRAQKVHLHTAPVQQPLDRAAYAILGSLHDAGPVRLSALAARFSLDVSTVSRQVQALEDAGLVQRAADPGDRRAVLLDLSEEGRELLLRARHHRRQLLRELLAEWPAEDREAFAELLARFNQDVVGRTPGIAPPATSPLPYEHR